MAPRYKKTVVPQTQNLEFAVDSSLAKEDVQREGVFHRNFGQHNFSRPKLCLAKGAPKRAIPSWSRSPCFCLLLPAPPSAWRPGWEVGSTTEVQAHCQKKSVVAAGGNDAGKIEVSRLTETHILEVWHEKSTMQRVFVKHSPMITQKQSHTQTLKHINVQTHKDTHT